jgi:hypothetical protein
MKLFLLLILLSACTNMPVIEDLPQCSPVFKYVKSVEGDEYISVKDSYCICGNYRFSLDYVGPQGGSWREPIKSCNKVIGWKPKDYGEVAAYWKEVRARVQSEVESANR